MRSIFLLLSLSLIFLFGCNKSTQGGAEEKNVNGQHTAKSGSGNKENIPNTKEEFEKWQPKTSQERLEKLKQQQQDPTLAAKAKAETLAKLYCACSKKYSEEGKKECMDKAKKYYDVSAKNFKDAAATIYSTTYSSAIANCK